MDEEEKKITIIEQFKKIEKNEIYTEAIKLYINYLKNITQNNYEHTNDITPNEKNALYKLHTAFMNITKIPECKNCIDEYKTLKKIKDGSKVNAELLLSLKKIENNTAQEYEKNIIEQLGKKIYSQSSFLSNEPFEFITGMVSEIKNVLSNPMGKFSSKFIKTNIKGQSSMFSDKKISEIPIMGVCSRNIKNTNNLLWDGSAGYLKTVAFLFSKPDGEEGETIINGILNNNKYALFLKNYLTEEQFDEIQDNIKNIFNKKNKDKTIPSGYPSMYFPYWINENIRDYVLLTPLVSGDVQLNINEKKYHKNIYISTKTMRRGGSNPKNGGWLNKITNGNHVHLYSEIKKDLFAFKENKSNYENLYKSIIYETNEILKLKESFNNILNTTDLKNRKDYHLKQLEGLSRRITDLCLEDLSYFIEDYELYEYLKNDETNKIEKKQKECSKNMHPKVYKAIVLFNEEKSEDFIDMLYNDIKNIMTYDLLKQENTGILELFKTNVKTKIREMFNV
jgi:hypothetical protein